MPFPNGHLQAVGTDDAGRRQYLYHPDWRARRDAAKFERVLELRPGAVQGARAGADRPRHARAWRGAGLRGRRTAAGPGLLPDRQRRLRRGERQLRPDHPRAPARAPHGRQAGLLLRGQVRGRALHRDRRPGGGGGAGGDAAPPRPRTSRAAGLEGRPDAGATLDSATVNDYIRETTGMDATAKDFRTWHATVIAAASLAETEEPGDTKASRKRAVVGGDEGGRRLPGQHPDAGPLGVRRPPGGRRLRGGPHDRVGHPAQLRDARRAPGVRSSGPCSSCSRT